MKAIDLNCDMGESFGVYKLGNDEGLLGIATSANIACGFHAGDPSTMRQTAKHAMVKGVGIGAHPGLPDLAGFGRRNLDVSPEEVYDFVLYQIGALDAIVRAQGGNLSHVKPHGALYNMAAKNAPLARAISEAVAHFSNELILFGLSGSELIREGKKAGLQTASEVFADRTYQEDGSLTPRSHPDALIPTAQKALDQVIQMVTTGTVNTLSGTTCQITADTICLHGDNPEAVGFARIIRHGLEDAGITVKKISIG